MGESIRPSCIMDIIYSGEHLVLSKKKKKQTVKYKNKKAEEIEVNPDGSVSTNRCIRCGYLSSNEICKACTLLQGLEMSRPKLAVDSEADGAAKLTKTLEGI